MNSPIDLVQAAIAKGWIKPPTYQLTCEMKIRQTKQRPELAGLRGKEYMQAYARLRYSERKETRATV